MGTISLSLPSDGQTIDAADVNTPLNTISAVINGNLDDDNVKVGANINGTKLLINSIPPTAGDANMRGGWNAGIITAMPTVTALGNRSYSLVHATTDLTGYLSPGMRLKLTRTVTAPTQCTSLNGTTQYYSKASPAGLSFTDTFTVSAWVKASSYPSSTSYIMARRNVDTEGWSLEFRATGQIALSGLRIAGNNRTALTYQSIPLNKWVHVAMTMSMSTGVATSYIDGVSVPNAVTTTGTATALVQGTADLTVGQRADLVALGYFPGKIAQAAVYSAVLSSATILAAATQTLSGSETSLISAYSFNGIKTDLNTSNANNLTANGSAVETTLDTPFTQTMTGVTTGTTNYGIITAASFSTNTTLTVQVAEGDTIPTSGGVSAISYSTQKTPYGFPAQRGKWTITSLFKADFIQSSPVAGTWYNLTTTSGVSGGCQLTIPVGEWIHGYEAVGLVANAAGNAPDMVATLSTANNTESDKEMSSRIGTGITGAAAYTNGILSRQSRNGLSLAAATNYYLNVKSQIASAANLNLRGSTDSTFIIYSESGHL